MYYTIDTLIKLQVALIESHELSYASGTFLIYDYIICFGEEVRPPEAALVSLTSRTLLPKFEYFWTGSWSLSTVLYFFVRVHSVFLFFFYSREQQIRYMSLGFAS